MSPFSVPSYSRHCIVGISVCIVVVTVGLGLFDAQVAGRESGPVALSKLRPGEANLIDLSRSKVNCCGVTKEVSAIEEGKSMRSLLSIPVALANRSRILWIAKTHLKDNSTTFVRFIK